MTDHMLLIWQGWKVLRVHGPFTKDEADHLAAHLPVPDGVAVVRRLDPLPEGATTTTTKEVAAS